MQNVGGRLCQIEEGLGEVCFAVMVGTPPGREPRPAPVVGAGAERTGIRESAWLDRCSRCSPPGRVFCLCLLGGRLPTIRGEGRRC
jgi:hypothetical protein